MKNSTPQLLHKVTSQLLNGKANVTLGSWKESLQRHPQYPSMQSLADTLQRWGFDNAALRLVPEQLAELSYPYIAHFRDQGGKFVGVLDRKDDQLRVTDGAKESWTDLASFEKSWSGAILLMEPKEKNGDPEYVHKRKVEIIQSLRLPLLLGASAVLLLLTFFLSPAVNFLAVGYLLLSIVGLGLSIALVSLHLEGKNSPAQKLCQTSDTTDCLSVLDSPAASLFGLFSWAELGMLYFSFQLIALLIGVVSGEVTAILSLIAVLSIPIALYVPYSIYYQAHVAKQWCRFCLGVQGVLVLELAAALTFISSLSINAFTAIPILWGFSMPVLIWLIVKTYWVGSIKGKEAINDLRRFQSNEVLFEEILSRQEPMPLVPHAVPVFRFGNPNAPNTLTVVTNPYCNPCALAHEKIDKLLLANLLVKVEAIVLTGSSYEDKRTRVAAHWLALMEANLDIHKAISEWYKMPVKDYDNYVNLHTCDEISPEQLKTVSTVANWSRSVNIDGTPSFYVNGRKLPDFYRIEDLEFLLTSKEISNIEVLE